MLIERLLSKIENELFLEEADIEFNEALALFEDLKPTNHFNKRLGERLHSLYRIVLTPEMNSEIPKEIIGDVKNLLIAQTKKEVAEKLRVAYRTQYQHEDRNIVITLKIAVVKLKYKGKLFTPILMADYEGKENVQEGFGDMFYGYLYNEDGITFIIGNSKASDEELIRGAKDNAHRFNPRPFGYKVMSLNRTPSMSQDINIVLDVDAAVKKFRINMGGDAPIDPSERERKKVYKLSKIKMKSLDLGVTMNVPEKGRGIIRNITWHTPSKTSADLAMEFPNKGLKEIIKVMAKD
jgi:hypothetical protein